jgi:hypothetical protein
VDTPRSRAYEGKIVRRLDEFPNQAVPTSDLCGFTGHPQMYDENQAVDDFGGIASLNLVSTDLSEEFKYRATRTTHSS